MNTPLPISRQKLEAQALEPFVSVVDSLSLPYTCGQGSGNRLPIKQNVYFQFGDLRVELPKSTVLIEVESSGGVTNLAKYWESFASHRISKPVKLLHLFRQKSANDYEAHLVVWRFLSSRMQEALGPKFECECKVYRQESVESLTPALVLFRKWLNDDAGNMPIDMAARL